MSMHKAFTCEMRSGWPKRIVWKMSIDLSRPLVSSMGQHDPLDGLVTYLELQTASSVKPEEQVDLTLAIADMTVMCTHARWATDDPLGIGGLLEAAARLAQLALGYNVDRYELLHELLMEAERSLRRFSRSSLLGHPAEHRLAFRELGLSIGIHGLQMISGAVANNRELAAIFNSLLLHRPLAELIQAFWSEPAHRHSSTWMDHCDINAVMLATSLAPEGYLRL
jgi:hypothetical protein